MRTKPTWVLSVGVTLTGLSPNDKARDKISLFSSSLKKSNLLITRMQIRLTAL